MKKLLIYGACLLLSMGAVSCHGDDPLTNNTVRPEVPATPNKLSGVITDVNGNPVAGATVTLDDGRTTTTDQNGYYEFEDVPAGPHTIKVKKDGMFSDTRDVNVSGSQENLNYVEGFTLNNKVTKTLKVVPGQPVSESETSQAIPGNEQGKVEIIVDVPADALEDEDGNPITDGLEIYLTPIYTEETANVMEDTRASYEEKVMLIGATLHCSKPNIVIKKAIDIKFDLDDSVVGVENKIYNGSDDNWSDAPADIVRVENGNIIFSAKEFTSYGIFIDLEVNNNAGRNNLTFTPSLWDNLDGTSVMMAESSRYTYKSGSEILSTASNKLEGLLIEHLARLTGVNVKDVVGTYDVNTSISAGAALRIWGYQEKLNWTITAKLSRRQVKAVSYNTVSIFTEGWLREHNGGGSNN